MLHNEHFPHEQIGHEHMFSLAPSEEKAGTCGKEVWNKLYCGTFSIMYSNLSDIVLPWSGSTANVYITKHRNTCITKNEFW